MAAPLSKHVPEKDFNIYLENFFQAKMAPLNKKNLEQANNIEVLTKVQAAQQLEIKQLKAKIIEDEQKFAFLAHTIKDLQTENKHLKEEMQKKENVALDFQAENLQLGNDNQNLQVYNAELKGGKDGLQIEKDQLLRDVDRLGRENLDAVQQKNDIIKLNQDLEKEKIDLKNYNHWQIEKNVHLEHENNRIKAEKEAEERRNEELQATNNELIINKQYLLAKNQNLEAEKQDIEARIGAIQR